MLVIRGGSSRVAKLGTELASKIKRKGQNKEKGSGKDSRITAY